MRQLASLPACARAPAPATDARAPSSSHKYTQVDLLARLFRSRYSLLIKLAYHHIAADGFRRDEYVDNEGPSYIVDDALNKMAIFGSRTDWFQVC